MGSTHPTNRRAFLKSSALVAAPLAAVATPAAALAANGDAARLARLEDERAIEALHRAFLRDADPRRLHGPAGKGATVERIEPDPRADPPAIAFADDGRRATARHGCTLHLAHEFDGDSTIERMARLQGTTAGHHARPCVVVAEYRKQSAGWALASAEIA